MLSVANPVDCPTGAGRPAVATLARAWWPSTRGLPLGTLTAVAGLAAAPTMYRLVRGDTSLGGALVAAAVFLGTTSAFVVDDPAEETLAASPTSLARRRLLRLGAIFLGVAVVALVLVTIASAVGDVSFDELGRRAAELAAVSGLAAAAAASAHRRSVPTPAHGGAVVGLVGVALISALAYRFHRLPALTDSPVHERWWWLAAAGWALAAWSWRDPAR